jgi:putative inorganic carbon (hco3(-)) transporter
MARRPSLLLATVTCALAPAYVVRFKIVVLPTTLLELAILVTIAVFAIETFRNRTPVVWKGPFTIPALIFLAAGAISVLTSSDHRAALGLYRAYLIEPIAFGVVIASVVNDSRRALILLAGLAAGGLVAGMANTVVVLAALRSHTYDVVATPPVVIYNTANAVALYLVPLVAVSASIALHATNLRLRVAGTIVTAIAVLAVFMSFSRGGYLALAAVAIGLALSHRLRWWLVAAGVVASIALLRVPQLAARVAIEADFNHPNNTLVSRFHIWQAALQMLSTRPIFGAGLSGFSAAVAPYWNATHIERYTYPHNILLNFWTETGLLGLAAFLWILFVAFTVSWQGWRRANPDWRPIHLGVFLALVAVVVHGLVDVPYFKNDLSLEFWTLVAVSWAGVQLLGRESPAPRAVAPAS